MSAADFRTDKHGKLETVGERQARLDRSHTAKVLGTIGLAAGGIALLFNAASESPVLYPVLLDVLENDYLASTFSRIADGLAGGAALVGATWMGLSAYRAGQASKNADAHTADLPRDYRRGDHKKIDAQLAAKAAALKAGAEPA